MAKITKRAEILENLHKLMSKEAEVAQTNISGEPLKDTKATQISESTETTDKNNVGPDKLNNEQGYEQKPTSDASEPLKGAKTASDSQEAINKMASEIMEAINTKLAANAQTNISGKPLEDTKATQISESTETTNKNDVGPDKLNKDQCYEQKPTDDKSEPLKGAKKAEDAELAAKIASFELGRTFCDLLLNQLQKTAGAKQQVKVAAEEAELLKEAGRRDFDTLIAQAAAELETQQAAEAEQEKLAEYQGAVAFDELYKQAQLEAVLEENNSLKVKLAAYEEKEKQLLAKEAAEKEEARFAKMAELVFEKLKSELQSTPAVK